MNTFQVYVGIAITHSILGHLPPFKRSPLLGKGKKSLGNRLPMRLKRLLLRDDVNSPELRETTLSESVVRWKVRPQRGASSTNTFPRTCRSGSATAPVYDVDELLEPPLKR